jgi:hypothetical protein
VKSALSLVVRLLLEHLNVPEEKSCVEDSLMKDIKKSSKEETIHPNSIGKVNTSFAKFVVKLYLHQNEDQAWKLFGKRKLGQL